DLLACCHPEELPPELRAKSVLQKEGPAHLMRSEHGNRIRLTSGETAPHVEGYSSSVRLEGSSGKTVKDVLIDEYRKGGVGNHDVNAYLRTNHKLLNAKASRMLGYGYESVAILLESKFKNPQPYLDNLERFKGAPNTRGQFTAKISEMELAPFRYGMRAV